jgi:GTP:adenosylcobinamide-phosphate guanylyltransferase
MELSPHRFIRHQQPVQKWTTILLAGDRTGGNPLTEHFGQTNKSLVEVAGKPMLAHVLATLLDHPKVGDIHILAQNPKLLFDHPALAPHCDNPRLHFVQSGNGIASSLAAVLRMPPLDWPILVTTADHVLLDGAMIDWFMTQSGSADVAVGVVNRAVAAADGLDKDRTWLKFRDVQVTGANLFALKSEEVFAALEYWSGLEQHRKRPWRMALQFGPGLLLAVLLRRLTLARAVEAVGRKLGVRARAVQIPYARAGVDVDKVADHLLVERLLAHDAA